MSVSDIFDIDKIISVATDMLSLVAIILSFLGVVALYKIMRKAKSK